jgi:Flp pilus assembly protein TadG
MTAYAPLQYDVSRSGFARRFANDRSGNIAIIFALTAMTVVGLVGGAVDVGRYLNAKTQNTAALDAAVLAAGRVLQTNGSIDDATAAAQQYYNRMKSHGTFSDTTSFQIVDNATRVRAIQNAVVATPFLSVAGVPGLEINAVAEAVLAVGGNGQSTIEISMMLDVTGSMGTSKLNDMKDAAKDLIDIVIWEDQSEYTSKIALVPFAPAVNVGEYFEAVTGKNPAGTPGTPAVPPTYEYPANCYRNNGNLKNSCKNKPEYMTDPGSPAIPGTPAMSTCVVDRQDVYKYTDQTPGTGPASSRGWIPTWNEENGSTSTNCTPWATVMPLSNDKDALKSRIDSFSSSGMTAGALGTAWAWHMISPNWATIWPATSTPRPYSELTEMNSKGEPKLRKIAILLTDGEYNYYGGNSANTSQVSAHAQQICNKMKEAGITVYTIGFEIGTSGWAFNTMRDCATSPSHFFNSSSGDELRQAFREIALQISTLRITK